MNELGSDNLRSTGMEVIYEEEGEEVVGYRQEGSEDPHRNAGMTQYLMSMLDKLDYLEYGDPSVYLAARSGKKVTPSPLSDVWVPPVFVGREDRNQEVSLDRLMASPSGAALVLAHPGHGKSTVSRFLMCTYARRWLEGSMDIFPIYVPLSDFRLDEMDYEQSIVSCASKFVALNDNDTVVAAISSAVGESLLVFDGLDELPIKQPTRTDPRREAATLRREAAETIRSVLNQRIGDFEGLVHTVVTSRVDDYQEDEKSRISPSLATPYTLGAFAPDQVPAVIQRWHGAAQSLAAEFQIEESDLADRSVRIIQLLRGQPELGKVCQIPLMLNLLQTVYADSGDLPSSVSQLCIRAIRSLLLEKPAELDPSGVAATQGDWILHSVAEIGFVIHERAIAGERTAISEDDIRVIVRKSASVSAVDLEDDYGTREDVITQVVLHLTKNHGILVAEAEGMFGFAHNVFREVMAGRALGHRLVLARKKYALDENWHLPIRYWAGMTAATPEGLNDISAFVGQMGRSRRQEATLAKAEMMSEVLSIADYGALTEDLLARIKKSRKELLRLLENSELVFRRRLRAGEMLGALGDDRLARPVEERLFWVEDGPYIIGRESNHKTRVDKYGECPAAPQVAGTLARFAVGSFEVTNAEFAAFVDDKGYQQRQFWHSEDGWRWASQEAGWREYLISEAQVEAKTHFASEVIGLRLVPEDIPDQVERMVHRSEPMYWADPSFNRPNQPIIGINWWEANAYCAWLTDLLRESGRLPFDWEVGLPTEAEWECAARLAGSGDKYPWVDGSLSGSAHLSATVRSADSEVSFRTCAVGLFPFVEVGIGSIFDVAGNVWEWTASEVQPYGEQSFVQRVVPNGLEPRISRGSSWLSSELESAEVTFRSFDPPFFAYEDLGCRIAVRSSQ